MYHYLSCKCAWIGNDVMAGTAMHHHFLGSQGFCWHYYLASISFVYTPLPLPPTHSFEPLAVTSH